METESKVRLADVFVGIRDPRQAKKVNHDLVELLVVAVCGVLAGADDFVEIEAWATEKLDWFRIINIAGEQLTDQELRNAVYAGSWVSDAKRYFSKTGCAASTLADDYLKGSSIRQEFLEKAISWAAAAEGKSIEGYMAEHQNDPTAQALWSYFRSVIEWVQAVFPKKRKEMKGLPWGLFYNEHHERRDLDPKALEERVSALMADEDVTKKSGVYEFLLTGNEKALSIRAFDQRTKREAYERQGHKCAICGEEFEFEKMHGDHIKPWVKGYPINNPEDVAYSRTMYIEKH